MPKLILLAMISIGLAWMPTSDARACEDWFAGWWLDQNTGIRYMHRARQCAGSSYVFRYVDWEVAY